MKLSVRWQKVVEQNGKYDVLLKNNEKEKRKEKVQYS